MRSISLKTIFIFLIILLIIYAIYSNYIKNNIRNNEKKESEEITSEKTISTDLRIGVAEFDNINPILSNNKNVQNISRLIYEPLFNLTEAYKLEPCLAKEWTRISDRTYLIKLRENVLWQDGKKFDSSDVEFTIDMLKQSGINSVYSYNVDKIISVEKVDEYTIRLEIENEELFFEYNLIFPIMSSKYYKNYNEFISESKNRMPVGTGMFYISETDEYTIGLKKNTNWWNNSKKEVKLQNISLNLYNSMNSMFTDFKNSKLDIFTTSNLNIENYIGDSGYLRAEYINRNYTYLALNCDNTILQDNAVRRAIALAIDKNELINKLFDGKYIKSDFPLDFGSYAYKKENDTIEFNQDKAQDELVNNGWSYEKNYWRKKENYKQLKIELKLIVNEENSKQVEIGEEIAEQLSKIGINVKVKKVVKKEYNKYIDKKNYDIILMDRNYGYSPDISYYLGDENISNYKSERMNKLLVEFKYLSSNEEIQKNCSEIIKVYNEDCPYVGLFYDINTLVYSKELKGRVAPTSYNLFYNINEWYREIEK